MADDAGAGEDDEEWKFSVDEVGPDDENGGVGDDTRATTIGEDDDGPTVRVGGSNGSPESANGVPEGANGEDGGGNVAGSLALEEPVEPGTPTVENAVFVTAGALLAVLVFASLVVSDPFVLAGLAVAVVAGSAGLYAILTRF